MDSQAPSRAFGAAFEFGGNAASTNPVPVDRFGDPVGGGGGRQQSNASFDLKPTSPTLNVGAREWKPPTTTTMTPSAAVTNHQLGQYGLGNFGPPSNQQYQRNPQQQQQQHQYGGGMPMHGQQQQHPHQQQQGLNRPAGGGKRGGGGGGGHVPGSRPYATAKDRNPNFGHRAAGGLPPPPGYGDSLTAASGAPTSDNGFTVSSEPQPPPQHTPTAPQQRKPQPQVRYASSQHQAVEIQNLVYQKQIEARDAALAAQRADPSGEEHVIPSVMEVPPGPKPDDPILVLGIPFVAESVPSYVDKRDWRLRIIYDRVDSKGKADSECEGKRLKHDFMYGDQMRIPLSSEATRELADHLRPEVLEQGSPVGLDGLRECVNFFPLDVRPPQHGYPRHVLCLGPNIEHVDTHRAFFAFCGQIPGSVNATQLLDVIAFLTHLELPPPIAVEKVGDGRCARVYYRTWDEVKTVVAYNHCALIGEYGCWIGTRNAAPALRAWHECRKREVFPKGVGPLSLEFPKDKQSSNGAPMNGGGR